MYTALLILIGSVMLVRPVCVCQKSGDRNSWFAFLSRRFVFNPTAHLFVMGAVLAVIPCPPMGAMLLYSLKTPTVISGGIIMALFGIGTALFAVCHYLCFGGFGFPGKLRPGHRNIK